MDTPFHCVKSVLMTKMYEECGMHANQYTVPPDSAPSSSVAIECLLYATHTVLGSHSRPLLRTLVANNTTLQSADQHTVRNIHLSRSHPLNRRLEKQYNILCKFQHCKLMDCSSRVNRMPASSIAFGVLVQESAAYLQHSGQRHNQCA
jgi:hypothetical protein